MDFIRTVVDQLEDSSLYLSKAHARQVRIGFLLIDNACELWLLRRAKTLAAQAVWGLDADSKRRVKAAQVPVERYFGEKLRLVHKAHPEIRAQLTVLGICHAMRNELYHSGLVQTEILGPLARGFFHAVLDLLEAVGPSGMSWGGSTDEQDWLTTHGVDHTTSLLSGGMKDVVRTLRPLVAPAMPELAEAVRDYISIRVEDVLSDLSFLVENGHGLASSADALAEVQFGEALERGAFPDVSAAGGTHGVFKALDDARAVFRPKIRLGQVKGWSARAARLTAVHDERLLIKAWSDIEKDLRPIEELVGRCAYELEDNIDSMRD